ncbi:IF4E-domain-containing protein [Viridothelium virens]|uniref:IF4E-domain-containing protein n=1 Tax=Viridothelium virens TaxID=1048519 RepID=A0A6A6GX57_VIRVR|nr:IF4E-domain-containing protein [Viridothelium virens]
MDRSDNLWTRRSNSNKLSLNNENHESKGDHPTRNYSSAKRFGSGDSGSLGRGNPFNAISPLNTNTTSSPTSGASNAFGLGSGAFASFSSSKTPKTPGKAFDWLKPSGQTPGTPSDKRDEAGKDAITTRANSSIPSEKANFVTPAVVGNNDGLMALKYTWVIWYRPPTSKNSDYEKSTKPICKTPTAIDFWKVFTHLKRPSSLPTVSDYHFFREGIRPVWEDEENKMGGKWIMRLKKGVADRYWEDLLMAMIGDQFAEASDEVCGAVLSVRSGEDVLSIWTKNNGGRNIKIRETIKRVLALPGDTYILWKSHDESIAQRSAIDQARQDKTSHTTPEKRRDTISEEPALTKEKSGASS